MAEVNVMEWMEETSDSEEQLGLAEAFDELLKAEHECERCKNQYHSARLEVKDKERQLYAAAGKPDGDYPAARNSWISNYKRLWFAFRNGTEEPEDEE